MIYGRVAVDTSGLAAIASLTKRRTITKKGVTAGARVIQQDAKARAPHVSGALEQSIGVKAEKGRKGKTLSYALVGARRKVVKMVVRPGRRSPVKAVPANYLHLVEGGTRPHGIDKGDRLARRGKAAGQVGQGGRMHPGAHPWPFLKSAFEARAGEAGRAAIAAMSAALNKAIATEAARLNAKKGK